MTRTAIERVILALLLVPLLAAAARAQELKRPEFVAVRVGFADRYKAGLWTPIEVTLHGGSRPEIGRVRATLADSDGLNCSYDAPEPCQVLPGEDTKVVLYVRFGHDDSTLGLEFSNGRSTLAEKRFNSNESPRKDQFPDALRSNQRLIVSVARSPLVLEKAADSESTEPGRQGQGLRNVVATVDSLARLPTRWEGYEGVDIVVISTSRPEVFENILPENVRIEALEQWVRMGGKLVLCAGSQAEAALHPSSPLARFVPGRFDRTVLGQVSAAWETYTKSHGDGRQIPSPKPGEKVELPTPRLVDVRGTIEARAGDDLPLVIRNPLGLGQVVFVAADVDRGPLRDWIDRPLLLAAILDLPADPQAGAPDEPVQNYGYNDLAGQLRSALDVPRDVHLVPFFVVALLVIVYILLIGPGDYLLLRKLGFGMQWTWITFPTIVVLFAVGSYLAAYWLKGDQLRVSQVDLVDIDADGTARGASWFSIFSPRGESFDLTMRPRLPGGEPAHEASDSLAWLGKAGNEFNGMYNRNAPEAAPLWSQGYSIAPSLDAIRGVPIPVWASKSFAYRWLGHLPNLGQVPNLGLSVSLKAEGSQLSGTITNGLKGSDPRTKDGIALHHCFLAYNKWAYVIGDLRPGQSVEISPAKRNFTLSTYLSGAGQISEEVPVPNSDDGLYDPRVPRPMRADPAAAGENCAFDRSSRDMAYVLQAMMFYDAAGGLTRTGMTNDYQGFTDLSGLLKTGCAILVAMPPQDGSCRGGELLRGPVPKPGESDERRPLGSALDRHTTIYRFVLPVTQAGSGN